MFNNDDIQTNNKSKVNRGLSIIGQVPLNGLKYRQNL